MNQLGALGILSVTVTLSLSRPRVGRIRIQPALAALVGAFLTVTFGLLGPGELLGVLEFLALPVLTIVSLMTITIVSAQAGFFRQLAWSLAAGSRGDARRLYRRLFFAGTLTGTFFTNDAAVLIFTPMVFTLVEEIGEPGWTRENRIPFYFAVLYVANLVGALVISNPINIIVADWFGIGFVEYALWMFLPAITSMGVTYAGLAFYFRDSLPRRFRMPDPSFLPTVDGGFRLVCGAVLSATLLGFFSEPWTGIPVAFVALTGAVVLLLLTHARGTDPVGAVLGRVGWDAVTFVVGIFVVVNGLRSVGITDTLGALLLDAAGRGAQAGNAAAGGMAVVFSAVMNNHPTAGLMALAVGDLPLPELSRELMALSALIGGDLGPKMLPIGSLAALLWFRMLRQRGVEIGYGRYIRLGVPVTLAATALSLLVLNLEYVLVVRFLS